MSWQYEKYRVRCTHCHLWVAELGLNKIVGVWSDDAWDRATYGKPREVRCKLCTREFTPGIPEGLSLPPFPAPPKGFWRTVLDFLAAMAGCRF